MGEGIWIQKGVLESDEPPAFSPLVRWPKGDLNFLANNILNQLEIHDQT